MLQPEKKEGPASAPDPPLDFLLPTGAGANQELDRLRWVLSVVLVHVIIFPSFSREIIRDLCSHHDSLFGAERCAEALEHLRPFLGEWASLRDFITRVRIHFIIMSEFYFMKSSDESEKLR